MAKKKGSKSMKPTAQPTGYSAIAVPQGGGKKGNKSVGKC